MSIEKLRALKAIRKADKAIFSNSEVMPEAWKATQCELQFVQKAITRGKQVRVLRSGWPDFLVEEEGKFYAVEVKAPGDVIRPSQRRMFTTLEAMGVSVFVWSPKSPDRLQPWRRFEKKVRK